MLIKDFVYGDFEITDPRIENLIKVPTFQRLTDITQSGIPDKWFILNSYTRAEHSLGVYWLLKKFQASEREQIGGLLHDLSHRAFSHLYEWLVDSKQSVTESLSDDEIDQFLQAADITAALEKFSWPMIDQTDFSKFNKLDQEIPNICLDRYDYSVREYSRFKGNNLLFERSFPHLKWDDEQQVFYFDDPEVGLFYAEAFLDLQKNVFGAKHQTYCYELLIRLFSYALEKKYIELSDFSQGETVVITKIESQEADPQIKELLSILNSREEQTVLGINRIKKFRYVDPLVQTGTTKTFKRVTELFPTFKQTLLQAKEESTKGIQI